MEKKLNERAETGYVEVDAIVLLSLSQAECKNPADYEKVIEYLNSYFSSGEGKKEWPDLSVEVEKADDDFVKIEFSGELSFQYYPGTRASWNDPGDPGELDNTVEDDDFEQSVVVALRKMPFDVEFTDDAQYPSIKNDSYLKFCTQIDDASKIPDDDDYWEAVEDAYANAEAARADYEYDRWVDSQFDSVMRSVLDGHSLTEALNEAGEEISSEEIYGKDSEKEDFLAAKDKWKKEFDSNLLAFFKLCSDIRICINDGRQFGFLADKHIFTTAQEAAKDLGHKLKEI